ncbi:MAG: HAMP domain-containing histidine kinase [Bifidobacteriaceae bacterium]|nr:HAMP domain-containing histidine kinase [Bifidobacteriaceae bacterium]
MNLRRFAVTACAALAALVALTWVAVGPGGPDRPDLPALNDVVARLAQDREAISQPGYRLPEATGVPPYTVIDLDGRILAASGPQAPASYAEALARRDTVLNIGQGSAIWGQALFATGADAALSSQVTRLRWAVTGVGAALAIVFAGLLWRLDRRVLKPFRELSGFARQVAAGDLEAPLRMRGANAFGAFTEAFDLMRQELAGARERARQADRAKKELVASLGHDMLTPVASIKAVAELMAVKNRDAQSGAQLATIIAKADQINALASDLLEGALQDLELLNVDVREVSSRDLAKALAEADFRGWADGIVLPDCLVVADPLRWAQTVGNVVANSYKYGRAPLRVVSRIDGGALEVVITDAGPGADPEELALVTRKFYRGSAGRNQAGAGLGLYLAQHFMERMGGHMACANADPGFAVKLKLKLA